MPIRPELRPFYRSAQWIDARNRVLARANHRCERCGKHDRALIWTVRDGTGRWSDTENLWFDGHGKPCAAPANRQWHRIRVILTVAHLDHDPPAIDEERLRAWCQHCHLLYDYWSHRHQIRLMHERYAQQITMFDQFSQKEEGHP